MEGRGQIYQRRALKHLAGGGEGCVRASPEYPKGLDCRNPRPRVVVGAQVGTPGTEGASE